MYLVTKNWFKPLRISEHNYKCGSSVNLLLISDYIKQQYCWIKDISKMLHLQTSKHDHTRYVCFRCLNTLILNSQMKVLQMKTTSMVRLSERNLILVNEELPQLV